MKLKRMLEVCCLIVLFLGSQAHGAVVFSDDFESGNLQNWTINLEGHPYYSKCRVEFSGKSRGGNSNAMPRNLFAAWKRHPGPFSSEEILDGKN